MDKIEAHEANLNKIVSQLGMLPPYRQWIDRVAPISAKKKDVPGPGCQLPNRLRPCGRSAKPQRHRLTRHHRRTSCSKPNDESRGCDTIIARMASSVCRLSPHFGLLIVARTA